MSNLVMIALVVAAIALVGTGMANTGPNCPGMDPGYIGFCE